MPRRRQLLDRIGIADRIRQIRGFKMNQAQLGRLLGVTQTTVSKYEKGETLPTLDVLLKLSEIGGVSVDWILKGGERK